MKALIVFAGLALAILACGGGADSEASNTNATAAAAGPDAEKLYKQYCVTCHGVYGDMGASGAANLAESTLSKDERVKVIAEGRAGTAMIGFASSLEEEEIAALADYTIKLKK